MRKIFYFPLLAAAAVLSSCVQQSLEEPDTETVMATAELPVSEDGFVGTKSVVSENDNGFDKVIKNSQQLITRSAQSDVTVIFQTKRKSICPIILQVLKQYHSSCFNQAFG